ncbi:MAG: D-glycero-beta-D-manno-heptose 1-phosphate adenylyltransferase [Planctomycetia bacterium]|nr:D-glycero-beta-D-manno-heptose 1-phosphate adenylyltransferase [Planctomycetia bacterium]
MSHSDLLAAVDRLGTPRLLVVGDLMLDRYTWGNAERVSPEAPVILVRADKREARLGGAANVCQMVRGLEAEVFCAGVIGSDPDGAALRHLLHDAGVDSSAVLRDESRPTTVKERFIGRAANRHPHQILRVDHEVREPLSAQIESDLSARIAAVLDDVAVVLISDYAKGVCTPGLLRSVIQAATKRQTLVLVDPARGGDFSLYRGATTITPNRLEAELATGVKIRSPQDAFDAGKKLCELASLRYAIITLDSEGMAVVEPDGKGQMFPTRPRSVYDITGAGDMVLAMLGVALAAGAEMQDTVRLANVAGGLEVEQVGVVPITRDQVRVDLLRHGREGAAVKIVGQDDAARLAEAARSQGRKIIFTNGCYDLLHVGHVSCLDEAARQGDLLFVGVNSDRSARNLKGPGRPIRSQAERAAVLAALACVDYVTVFDADTPVDLIAAIRPDVLVKGGDYGSQQAIPGREFVESYGGRLHIARLVEGVSTTQILRSVAA